MWTDCVFNETYTFRVNGKHVFIVARCRNDITLLHILFKTDASLFEPSYIYNY